MNRTDRLLAIVLSFRPAENAGPKDLAEDV